MGSTPNKPLTITFEKATLRVGGRWVLSGVDWRIAPGQHWVIQGPNGAGKTTLARAILGEVAVVEGTIRRSWDEDPGDRPVMAMVSPEQVHRLHQRERLLLEMRHFSGRVNEATTARQVLAGERTGQNPGAGKRPARG
ncbi:MAG: ATP-binding cassette domain-containing protein, partial [Desulfosarcinaceae bacterium]